MTHSYEDIIRLDSEVPTPPYKVVSHSWRETSIYDAKNRRVCLFDLEDWSVTERNQYELEVKQHNLAQYIAAMPDAVGLLKKYRERLIENQWVFKALVEDYKKAGNEISAGLMQERIKQIDELLGTELQTLLEG